MIPAWFYKLLITMSVICLILIGYRIVSGEQNRSFIWYAFLFLMAIWFGMRQLRMSNKK
ncbi:hypothetical protein JCM19294_384 [Nonlabens tegetincola]|uniref:Uncharacterized protein n=1 Tax=Nonlabens tegetincola TaxID=323273 RepID=A0A090Q4B0_9FLAO|nr:hypothetical protein [Nonlabens tegetincola]GAK97845.1 hypothetical protein JCM19294_384 [Nonlabens tegetincola]